MLVDAAGVERFADRNREASTGDATRHPEFEIARWAVTHLAPAERAAATVYTSGEHCPMCSAAHAWVGLGRIVFAASSAQISGWRAAVGAPASPVAALPISVVAPGLAVDGPVDELVDEVRVLIERCREAERLTAGSQAGWRRFSRTTRGVGLDVAARLGVADVPSTHRVARSGLSVPASLGVAPPSRGRRRIRAAACCLRGPARRRRRAV